MKRAGIKAQVGYRSPRARKGEASIVTPNRLQRQFNPDSPDERWVTDITYIRTHEGWLSLAVVVDLFSRKVSAGQCNPAWQKRLSWTHYLWRCGGVILKSRYGFTLIRAVSQMPPAEYENLYYQRLRSVWIIRGNSVADNTSVTFYIRSNLTFSAQYR